MLEKKSRSLRSRNEMTELLIAVDSSEIREGRLDAVKAGLAELAEFVEANEPEIIAYSIYLDEEAGRMTVVQIHPSSASMELHMEIAAPVFRKFAGLLDLRRVDFYGTPSEALLERTRQKTELLGRAPVVVNEPQAGFARLSGPSRGKPG
jgi:hypothetical protein